MQLFRQSVSGAIPRQAAIADFCPGFLLFPQTKRGSENLIIILVKTTVEVAQFATNLKGSALRVRPSLQLTAISDLQVNYIHGS